jgi:hypothetical protein
MVTLVLDHGRRTRRHRAGITTAIAVVLLVLASGCSSGGSKKATSGPKPSLTPIFSTIPITLNGTWTGEWHATAGGEGQGTVQMTWQRAGRVMRGRMTVSGLSCMQSPTVQGTITGSDLEIAASENGQGTILTGTYTADSMSGTYTTSCDTTTGTWTMTKST